MLTKKQWLGIVLALAAVVAGLSFWLWAPRESTSRADLLTLMPADANAVGFLDLQQFRSSPFLTQLLSWAPQAAPDSDYAQFMQATRFDYERDMDRIALAFNRQAQIPWVYAIAEGRFDRKRIEAYAAQFSSLKTADGKTLYSVPVSGSERKAYFSFLRDDRIAWANDSSCFFQRSASSSTNDWQERFVRVAGTPIFFVLQQDSMPSSALALAPGGFQSPQLATLLGQLQWITISGKPEGNVLRVVIDGESMTETTAHQLKELLSGLVLLGEIGLNDAKTRKQLDPEQRQGYLDLLQSVDIQQLDRGTSKSVRIMVQVTPKLLQAPQHMTMPAAANPPVSADTSTKHAGKKAVQR
jgi:hypothetical protein